MGSAETAGADRRRLTRRATAAGSFYPDGPEELARTVDRLLAAAAAARPDPGRPSPAAIIVPHAGYAYSGPVAASAYVALGVRRAARVVLLGPSHFVPLRGIAASEADAWRTPLGEVVVDAALRSAAIDAGTVADDRPHAFEHALEVQLPFLVRAVPGELTVLPLAVGEVRPVEVADLLDALVPAADLVVVSTDLSHYLDQATARRLDRRTAQAVVARDPSAIGDGAACGIFALLGILAFAGRHDVAVRILDLRTSADTAGDASRVVGYGAFAMSR